MMFALALIALGAVLSPQAVWAQGSVKIGFLYPDSGPFAQLGLDMRDGFLLYWSEVEKGIKGTQTFLDEIESIDVALRDAPTSTHRAR